MQARDRGPRGRAAPEQLLEREAELGRIARLVDQGVSGNGQLVVLEGTAGIGKTRVLDVARERAGGDGVQVLDAVAGELEGDVTFAVVRRLFERAVASAAPRQRARLLAGAARFASSVVDPTVSAGPSPAAADGGGAVLHGLYWLAANLAERAPLLMVVDDAHWADAASGAWLLYLARRLEDMPLTLMLGVRSGEPLGPWLSALVGLPTACRIELHPLSAAGTASLTRATLGPAAEEEICAACHRATGGNPFMVAELTAALATEEVAVTPSRVAALSPAAVTRFVALRLMRLAPPAGQLARAVSVLGAGAPLRHAAVLAGLDPPHAAEASDMLVRAGILEPAELTFVHPILQTSVSADLTPAWRAQAHGIAARLLAAEGAPAPAIAAHFLRADPVGDPAAVDVLREAATQAIDAGTPQVAATLLRRALAEPPPPDRRGQVLYELGRAELVGHEPGAIEHLGEALRATRDGAARARIALTVGQAEVGAGHLVNAEESLTQAIHELGDADAELRAQIEAYRCALGSWAPQFAPAVASDLGRLRILADGGGQGARALLIALAFWATFKGRPRAEIITMLERGLAGIEAEAGHPTDPATWAVSSLTFLDELDRADRVLTDMFAHAQSAGSVPAFAAASACRASIALRRGQIDTAEDDARRVLELTSSHQMDFRAPHAYAYLGEALLERGELGEAAKVLEGADMIAMRGTRPDALFLHTRARARLARGDGARGLADLRRCQSIQEQLGFGNPNVMSWRSTLAFALPAGELDEARELVEVELDQARAIGQPRAIGVALRAKALLPGENRTIALLRDAAAVLAQSPSPLEYARALADLGAALRRSNQRSAAREPLRAALDHATRCGATALARRARDELVATGARPRRTVLAGPDALTPAESRVAGMAADGRSNRDIAQALFVSMKTVATHLGHTYQKLGLTSREELARALREVPVPDDQGGL